MLLGVFVPVLAPSPIGRYEVRREREMMTSMFRPPRWLRSPHLQTIGAAVPLFSPPRSHAVDEEEDLRVPVPSVPGSALHARAWWSPTMSAKKTAPAVIILHGIAGSKDSHCCVRAAVAFHRSGYHAIRVDMRGAGDSVVDAPSLYHAGITSDLDLVVRHVAKDPRVSGVLLLGFSGGGSQALKLAGEWGDNPPENVLAIASVSAPLDYTRVAARMDTLACLPYRFHVLRGLLDRARAFAMHHPKRAHYKPSDLDSIKRFRNYDGSIIVPMHGFDDVDGYYWAASSGRWLDRVRVPTILLHAEDDPMVTIDTVRPWLRDASKAVRVQLSKHGGHIGWLAGIDEASWVNSWSTREALAFFAEHTPPPSIRQVSRTAVESLEA
jgi:predicted alpha/beta-fold hydrolase